jgi:CobQ-like glutamine amidotransferase family enzyme
MNGPSSVRIGLIYPELMGTYGDRGNATVLERRLAWRGLPGELVVIPAGEPVPGSLDCYVLGGAEDVPQTLAAEGLLASVPAITAALDGGAVLLANCAGFQLLGSSYVRSDGRTVPGMGLVDATTVAGPRRCIGEVLVDPDLPGLPPLSGFENHAGITRLGPAARPLGSVRYGVGNGDGRDGALAEGRLVATYLHGPVLARNPALADLLLTWIAGTLPALENGEADALATRLRAERVATAAAEAQPNRARWRRPWTRPGG